MKKVSPYLVIMLSFLFIIIIGAILLALPIASAGVKNLAFIDAFFISTSAITITGLSPIPNLSETLSIFGKVVLTFLIQIGGLSVITISVFVMYLIGAKIGITNRVLLRESLNQNNASGMVKLVIRIVVFTFSVELIGFFMNLFVFIPDYKPLEAIGLSIFHAVSSFNNAGFDLLGSISLQDYTNNPLLNINTTVLIMIGGLGFIVINDMIEKRSFKRLLIHSKIVILMNIFLWSIGTIVFKVSEIKNTNLTWLQSFFLSVTSRTAGFATIDMGKLTSVTTLVIILLMFIGASPSSTGGGVKTTTIYTLFKSTSSYAKGKQTTTYERLIPDETKNKASILVFTSLLIIIMTTIMLLFFEPVNLETALFESVSAFSNTGLSKNLTPSLKTGSKISLSVAMFIGRVGPLTILSVINKKWHKKELENVEYIEEKMMIG